MDSEIYKPKIFQETLLTRFSDLDPYGHVNAKNYLDYVASARITFLQFHTEYPIDRILKEGFAFYLKSSLVNFRAPITGLTHVKVTSHVAEYHPTMMRIPYTMTTTDDAKTYSDGELTYVVINIKTGKPTRMPEWLRHVFFYET